MQISFERSGGFAGLRLHSVLDTNDLPPQEAQPLEEQIYRLDFFSLPRRIPPTRKMVDTFQYRVTVQDGNREHTVEVNEPEAPEELQALLQEIMLLVRIHRR